MLRSETRAAASASELLLGREGSSRLLAVLDQRLANRAWVMGDDYSIADIAIFPWVRNLVGFYGAADLVGFERYTHVARALAAFVARPAVQAGLLIPKAAA